MVYKNNYSEGGSMTNKINYKRRNFLQNSALGVTAAGLFPKLLFAKNSSLKSEPTPSFKADVEIEIVSREAYMPIKSGRKTKVQKYFAKLLKALKIP